MAIGRAHFFAPPPSKFVRRGPATKRITSVVKTEWGTKRTCQNCAARFYDLQRNPIVCPKCETVFEPPPPVKARRSRLAPEPKAAVVVPVAKKTR